MENSLDYYIKRLPPFIGNEIFKYLIDDPSTITFNNNKQQTNRNKYGAYNLRYEVAYKLDKVFGNLQKGCYLSRIPKKTGKHRYYITNKIEHRICQGCGQEVCNSYDCRGGWTYEHEYNSKYVGKDIQKAILELSFTQFAPLRSAVPIFISSQDKRSEERRDLNEW